MRGSPFVLCFLVLSSLSPPLPPSTSSPSFGVVCWCSLPGPGPLPLLPLCRWAAQLPPYLPKAFIAIEDRRFYSHFGIDPIGIGARARPQPDLPRGVAQGGSTLTQQLAKNLFLTQERTASRKIQEAILALWLERNYSARRDPRALSQPGLFRRRRLRRRGGGAALLRQVGAQGDAGGGGRARGPRAGALAARPNRNPERRQSRGELVLAAMDELGFITQTMTKRARRTRAGGPHARAPARRTTSPIR